MWEAETAGTDGVQLVDDDERLEVDHHRAPLTGYVMDKRDGDIDYKLKEMARPYLEPGTKLLVRTVLAGRGDDALAALAGIMAEVKAAEGEREPMSEDPDTGEGSPATVRRRAGRSTKDALRLEVRRDMRDAARADMVAELENAWRHPWEERAGGSTTLADPTPAKDAKATRDATYADYCAELENAWRDEA